VAFGSGLHGMFFCAEKTFLINTFSSDSDMEANYFIGIKGENLTFDP
jgi:hypothetical protein